MQETTSNGLPRVEVRSTIDIVNARQMGRELALEMGFNVTEVTLIAAAISEIARNILDHAKSGEIIFSATENHSKQRGLEILAQDHGPGIPDVGLAMKYGYSSRGGLGMGLPGAKWLVDEFEIESEPNQGTTIRMCKWLKNERSGNSKTP